jgi:hypothetical protein
MRGRVNTRARERVREGERERWVNKENDDRGMNF